MISLASELTDSKGRHARGWLFFDADCDFCRRIAAWLERPMRRRGLDVAPLQDARVQALLGLPSEELLSAIRYLVADGTQSSGADALIALADEFWWALPITWVSRIPAGVRAIRAAYARVARHRRCTGQLASAGTPMHVP
jgi:predicted DCC family thiol-disulfide oxidoreductase YuxK